MKPNEGDLYKPDGSAAAVAEQPAPGPESAGPTPTVAPPADGSSITWTASEYLHHDRGASWYALLIAGTLGLAAAVYFLTKDYFATGAIVIIGIIVAVFAARKPAEMTYEISESGLRVGQKLYSFSQFKSFSIHHEGGVSSLSLLPLKKLMPPVEALFGPADEEKITDLIGKHLPYDERKQAGIDRISRKLKF